MGSAKEAGKYINNTSYLARGHLAPDADFLYAAWQFSTYYYVNVMPQWQSINGGNWNRIERLVRSKAAKDGKDLKIITGSHEVLTLKDVNGNDVAIFMAKDDKIPVPKFTWKIVYDPEGKSAIVLVTSNNPFYQETFSCPDVCEAEGWFKKKWADVAQGLVRCCTYEEFRAVVGTSPKLVVSSTLKF